MGWALKVSASYRDLQDDTLHEVESGASSYVPGIESMDPVEYAENGTGSVLTAQAWNASGHPMSSATWSLGTGNDEGAFTISADGVLEFRMSPDYEQPVSNVDPSSDLASRNVYTVQVLVNHNGVTYSARFTITVTDVDEDPPGVPYAPVNLEAKPGDAQVVLTWDTPSNNGSSLTGYEYRQSADGAVTWSPDWGDITDSGSTTTSHTVESLSNGTEYTIEVRAVNAVGEGDSSRVSSTPLLPAPTGLTVTAEQDSLRVGWTAPSTSSSVSGYRLEYQVRAVGREAWSDTLLSASLGSGSRSHPHPGRVDSLYRFRVQAASGRWTEFVPASGAAPLPEGEPPLESIVLGDSEVSVTWGCPAPGWCAALPGASAPVYTLEWRRKSGSGSWTDWASAATGERTTISRALSGLDGSMVHEFQARPVNANGRAGPELPTGSAVVVPLRAQSGAGSVDLDWDAPTGNQDLDGWEYRHRSAGGSWGTWQAVPASNGSTRTHEVTGLSNGSYGFQVRGLYQSKPKVVSFVETATVEPPPPPSPSMTLSIVGQDSVWFAEQGTDTVATYRGVDGQGQPVSSLTWRLLGADQGDFAGAGDTLRFASAPDFEMPADADGNNRYQVTLGASATGPPASNTTMNVTVTVTDVNEPPEITVGATEVSFSEGSTDTVGTYRARDPEGASITWQKGGPDANAFTFSGDTLKFAQAPDFEAPSDANTDRVYSLEVKAYDGVLSSPPRTVEVTVTDVNEPPEITVGATEVSFSEGSTDTVGTYRARDPEGASITWQKGGPDADKFTFSGDTLKFAQAPDFEAPSDANTDRVYSLEVKAYDGVLSSPPRTVEVTVTDVNEPPVITSGATEVSFSEGSTDTVGTYRARDPEGASITWQKGGPDADKFTFSGDTLKFAQAPDFEAPSDANTDRVYSLEVKAYDGVLSSPPCTVEVAVRNVDEAGTVTLSPSQPRAGAWVTATLREPDKGVRVRGWQWQRRASEAAPWEDITLVGALSAGEFFQGPSYRPVAGDVGQMLRVTMSYTDGESADANDLKSAQSAATVPVRAGTPGKPGNLEASGGDRQVRLTWTPARDNGSVLTGYQYRKSTNSDSITSQSWTGITGSTAATTSHTVTTGLTNGQAFTFQVRAQNGEGVGLGSSSAEGDAVQPGAGDYFGTQRYYLRREPNRGGGYVYRYGCGRQHGLLVAGGHGRDGVPDLGNRRVAVFSGAGFRERVRQRRQQRLQRDGEGDGQRLAEQVVVAGGDGDGDGRERASSGPFGPVGVGGFQQRPRAAVGELVGAQHQRSSRPQRLRRAVSEVKRFGLERAFAFGHGDLDDDLGAVYRYRVPGAGEGQECGGQQFLVLQRQRPARVPTRRPRFRVRRRSRCRRTSARWVPTAPPMRRVTASAGRCRAPMRGIFPRPCCTGCCH